MRAEDLRSAMCDDAAENVYANACACVCEYCFIQTLSMFHASRKEADIALIFSITINNICYVLLSIMRAKVARIAAAADFISEHPPYHHLEQTVD